MGNSGFSQNDTRTLKGKIIADGEPMIGLQIALGESLEIIGITNLDGEFSIEVPKESNFKLQLLICLCVKRPKKIKVSKKENYIILRRKKCNFKKVKKLKT